MNKFLADAAPIAAGILGVLNPWLAAFFEWKLISDYFQPGLNGAASGCSMIAFLASWVWISRSGARHEAKLRVMVWFLAGAAACILICLVLLHTVDLLLAPGGWTWLLRITWITVYVLIYVCLAIGLCAAFLLIPKDESGDATSHSDGAEKK